MSPVDGSCYSYWWMQEHPSRIQTAVMQTGRSVTATQGSCANPPTPVGSVSHHSPLWRLVFRVVQKPTVLKKKAQSLLRVTSECLSGVCTTFYAHLQHFGHLQRWQMVSLEISQTRTRASVSCRIIRAETCTQVICRRSVCRSVAVILLFLLKKQHSWQQAWFFPSSSSMSTGLCLLPVTPPFEVCSLWIGDLFHFPNRMWNS